MAHLNTLVELRNDSPGTITFGTLSIPAGEDCIIWDTTGGNSAYLELEQVYSDVGVVNENIGNANLVVVIDSVDATVQEGFDQLKEIKPIHETWLSASNSNGYANDNTFANITKGTLTDLNSILSDTILDGYEDPRTPIEHADSHGSDGSDPIDGYNVDLTYTPVNYNSPTNDVVGEHIASIDDALASAGGGGGGSGDVVGPGSATDNAITRWSSADGVTVQNSGVIISDTDGISGILTAGFAAEGDAGNSEAAITLNFTTLGQKLKVTLTANTTFTFTFPGVGNYLLKVIQDATGSRTITLPGTSQATSGVLNVSGGADSVSILAIYWDGTNSYISSMPDVSTATVTLV